MICIIAMALFLYLGGDDFVIRLIREIRDGAE